MVRCCLSNAVIWCRFVTIEEGKPSVKDDTADPALTRTVSLTNVVPQSFVVMDRSTSTEQALALQAGVAATANAGI